MKSFLTVFEFELMNFVKAKSFIISTVIIAVLIGAATFAPRVIDMSGFIGTESDEKDNEDNKDNAEEAEKTKLAVYDASGYFSDATILESAFTDAEIITKASEKEVEKAVKDEEVEAISQLVNILKSK